MDKSELESAVRELLVEKEVEKRVRMRCIAFWSTILGLAAGLGSWVSSNILPIKAGLAAFWDAWGNNG